MWTAIAAERDDVVLFEGLHDVGEAPVKQFHVVVTERIRHQGDADERSGEVLEVRGKRFPVAAGEQGIAPGGVPSCLSGQ